jgi:hypothetical protein
LISAISSKVVDGRSNGNLHRGSYERKALEEWKRKPPVADIPNKTILSHEDFENNFDFPPPQNAEEFF